MPLFSRSAPSKIRELLPMARYAPDLKLQTLSLGVDNLRHDIRLSPRLIACLSSYTSALFIKHSNARRFLERPPQPPSAADRSELKRLVSEVLLGALIQSKARKIPELDLAANLAVFKYLGYEVKQQYDTILLQGKSKGRKYEGPKHVSDPKAAEFQQALNEFQTTKRQTLRLVMQELQRVVNEVQSDSVRKTRESLSGIEAPTWFGYFSNPLLCAENGRDDFIHLEKYVMIGNWNRDPDRFDFIEHWLRGFLRSMDQDGPEAQELAAAQARQASLAVRMEELRRTYVPSNKSGRGMLGKLFGGNNDHPVTPVSADKLAKEVSDLAEQLLDADDATQALVTAYEELIGEWMNVPENVDDLFGAARTEQQIAEWQRRGDRARVAALEVRLEAQKFLVDELYRLAEKAGLLPFLAASYEVARIHADFCPPINPQILKQALLGAEERDKVIDMIRHYRMPESRLIALREAAEKVRSASPRDLRTAMVRFAGDFFRHHRDAANHAATQALLDRLHLPMEDRAEQLSRINGTLYEFLISSEEQSAERKVTGHVILKADIRDSTRLTSELLARGLNPASYFSMNFYDPLNKLLPRYGAEKVFIEGDAVILALFEHESGRSHTVALACGMARELIEIVKLYNTKSEAGGLPQLEIGIGITFRNTAPLYLLDGEARIMISDALNLSDRLSGCHKLARKSLPHNRSAFNVFVLQTISEETAAGAMEEFLVRYNVDGICLSEDAFEKLCTEIRLSRVEAELPLLWGKERMVLHSGAVPLSPDVYQRLVVREALVPFVDPQTFQLKESTTRRYFEVCTTKMVYDHTDRLVSGVWPAGPEL
jgi:class 3 adenylate cyclase